jgi:hypothetical protein
MLVSDGCLSDPGGRLRLSLMAEFQDVDEMASLSRDVMRNTLDVPCPRCGYRVWVITAEIVCGSTVICPCCRVGIRLVDQTGSVQVAAARMQAAIQALGDVFRRRS